MDEVNVTEETFDQEVLKSNVPVLVDFWAEWCGPCKIVHPILDEIRQEYSGKIKIAKVNVDEQNALAGRYNVMSIPNMKIFKGGQQVGEIVGAAPKQSILAELLKHM
ncbi:MAG: thioredoxin [Candidatus Doudnabacteria bacterium]|nr:thioredoxin [Candidatus Doudnabacteria bacterium]